MLATDTWFGVAGVCCRTSTTRRDIGWMKKRFVASSISVGRPGAVVMASGEAFSVIGGLGGLRGAHVCRSCDGSNHGPVRAGPSWTDSVRDQGRRQPRRSKPKASGKAAYDQEIHRR